MASKFEDVDPTFSHFKEEVLPLKQVSGHSLQLVVGQAFNEKSKVPTYSDIFHLLGDGKAQAKFNYKLNENQEAAIYVLHGKIEIENRSYKRFDMIVFKKGVEISLKSLAESDYIFPVAKL